MSNKNAFTRVFNMLFDHEMANEDSQNTLCVLGRFFNSSDSSDWPPEFIQDVFSRIWITYRTGFPAIPKSANGPSPLFLSSILRTNFSDLNLNPNEFTSDVGWGCMIRTSQSLLANTLQQLLLGRDFEYGTSTDPVSSSIKSQDATNAKIHDSIIDWFNDCPDCFFSLHNFVRIGMKHCNKNPGEWFGPNAASLSIKYLCQEFSHHNEFDIGLNVIISETGDVYSDEVLKKSANGSFEPTLILLAIRLGIDNINPIYYSSLLQLLSLNQSMGIAGGRPSSSHYFFGYQGNYLFYLDPHQPQHSGNIPANKGSSTEPINEPQNKYETYHTRKIRKLNLKDMDPSMLVGFMIKDEEDYDNFKVHLSDMNFDKPKENSGDETDLGKDSTADESTDKNASVQANKIVHFHKNRNELTSSSYMGRERRDSDFENVNDFSNSEVDVSEEFVDDFNDEEEDDFVDLGLEFNNLKTSEEVKRTIPEEDECGSEKNELDQEYKPIQNSQTESNTEDTIESESSLNKAASENFTKIEVVYEEPILVDYELNSENRRLSSSDLDSSKFEELSRGSSSGDKIEFTKEKTKVE